MALMKKEVMKFGKLIDTKLEIIPTANKGFIVKFGNRGRLAFESEEALFDGLKSFLNDPAPWEAEDLIRKPEEGEK